jgi:hypothetical protein
VEKLQNMLAKATHGTKPAAYGMEAAANRNRANGSRLQLARYAVPPVGRGTWNVIVLRRVPLAVYLWWNMRSVKQAMRAKGLLHTGLMQAVLVLQAAVVTIVYL